MGKAYRLTPNAASVVAAKKLRRMEAQTDLPVHDAFMLINNPSNPQQTTQIKKLTETLARITRGLIGG